MVHRVQSDLAVAGSFADFLYRSNAVFRTSHAHDEGKPGAAPKRRRSHTKDKASNHYHQHHQHHQYHQHHVSPDDIQLEQLESGEQREKLTEDTGKKQQQEELKDGEEKEKEQPVQQQEQEQERVVSRAEVATGTEAGGGAGGGGGSTAVVKRIDRSLMNVDPDSDEEPELHAL